jgi:hypothetical protein
MKHVAIGVLFPAFLTAACDSASTRDPAADRQAIAAATAQFQAAENAGSVDQCRSYRGTERYTLTPKAGGAPILKSGNYLYLYQRQEDGSWKQSRVIWN